MVGGFPHQTATIGCSRYFALHLFDRGLVLTRFPQQIQNLPVTFWTVPDGLKKMSQT